MLSGGEAPARPKEALARLGVPEWLPVNTL